MNFREYKMNSYSKSVVCTRMREINNQLKWLIIKWFKSEQHMVDKQVSINLSNPATWKQQQHIIRKEWNLNYLFLQTNSNDRNNSNGVP